jgi:hypothetical protein
MRVRSVYFLCTLCVISPSVIESFVCHIREKTAIFKTEIVVEVYT